MFFNFDGSQKIDTCYFDLRGKGNPTIFSDFLTIQLDKIGKNKGYICIPTINHDRQRPRSGPRDTYDQLKTVMAFLFTLPTVPLIYYGDEIGMRFVEGLPVVEGSQTYINRAGSRTPMQVGLRHGMPDSRTLLLKDYICLLTGKIVYQPWKNNKKIPTRCFLLPKK